MTDSVITIKDEHIIENIISKSRFIAHIKPVHDEDEAKAFIEAKKKNIEKQRITVRLTRLVIRCSFKKHMTMANRLARRVCQC